jgi:hypothetical protein
MSNFEDFLTWYNNLDVGPFVEAVENMQTFYFERQQLFDALKPFITKMSFVFPNVECL